VVDVEGSGDVEVAAAVFEKVEGFEVLVTLDEALLVAGCLGEFVGGVVGGEAAFDVVCGVEAAVVALDAGEFGVGVGFGEAVLDEVVEAWLAGGLDVGGDELATGTDFASETREIPATQVVFVVEESDEGEVLFGVGEELRDLGVAGEAGVVLGDEAEKLFGAGDRGVMDVGVPDSDWRAFCWGCCCLRAARRPRLLLFR
jgi:hypothetical protein